MKVLIIDNYDSFTFNLYQAIGAILSKNSTNFSLDVIRNNEITLAQIKDKKYDRIIISPGPGDPSDKKYFGVCGEVLTHIKNIPILGVCLGMQGMAYYFGGKVIKASIPMHGKTSLIKHDQKSIFRDLPQEIEVMRYHSLIVDPTSLPKELKITAKVVSNGYEIMAIRHSFLPIEGVQFHPESFATEAGKRMLENFILKGVTK